MKDNNNSAVESQQSDGVAMGTIYSITCIINDKPYVGRTRQKFEVRIRQHKSKSKNATTALGAAIRKYGWENFTAEIIEVCPVEMLNEREIYWIKKLNSKAPNGYNMTDGGDGLVGCTQETRDKIAAHHADVSGENNPNYGKKHSPETCAKMTAAKLGEKNPLFGKHHSSETCAKISAHHKATGFKPPSQKGKKRSPETCANISAAKKGKPCKPHSKETRDKIAASNKGKPSPNKGKPRSPETCANISAGVKAAWARRKKAIENGGES